MVVIVQRAAAKREDGKMDQRHDKHDLHGPFLSRSAKSCFGEDFSLVAGWIRSRVRGEGDEEQHQAKHRPDGHRHLPAVLAVVAGGELGDQRQRESADDELRGVHRDEAVGVQLGALVQVARHHAAQRRVGHVVHRVERHEQRVGDGGIGDHRAHAPALGVV